MIGRAVIALAAVLVASSAYAQKKPAPAKPRPVPQSRGIEIGGYAMIGRVNFVAADSFDALPAPDKETEARANEPRAAQSPEPKAQSRRLLRKEVLHAAVAVAG